MESPDFQQEGRLQMSNIVIYDPSDQTVANRVTQYFKSVNTPDYDGESNKLVNPDLSGVSGVNRIYWKVSGSDVVEMTAEEKTAIDSSIPVYKNRVTIIDEIFNGVSGQEQLDRLIAALDNYPTFGYALDDYNYTLARARANEALTNTDIIQADYDLIDSKIPSNSQQP